mgnify:CR=1 FL=1|jgi:hypothetical protein
MPSSPNALKPSYHAVHAGADGVVNNDINDGSRSESRIFEKQDSVIENHVARVGATSTVGGLVYDYWTDTFVDPLSHTSKSRFFA